MVLARDAVLALAPDASSASAGKKLADIRHWKSLGKHDETLWGECQGSALYQVRADLTTLNAKCSCPSRKLPCKHTLGLLLLAAASPTILPHADTPEWVTSWLAKRASGTAPAAPKGAQKPPEQVAAEQTKRAQKRLALVRDGLDRLDLWMCDLVRNGLSVLETQGARPWEVQAARMVDAQAPGVAARLRAMAQLVGSRRDWPAQLLAEMGKLALLTHAFRRIEALDPALREDVRQLLGWTLTADEVAERGEHATGEWLILGQWIEEADLRVRTQRTWLAEAHTGRPALILQFSVAGAPFPELLVPGTQFSGELVYWPSAFPLRARVVARQAAVLPLASQEPGADDIVSFLGGVADALAKQPWLDRFPCLLHGVTPIPWQGRDDHGDHGDEAAGSQVWHVCDATGHALPLTAGDHWTLLSHSGGSPVDLAGEWDGEALLPLGVMAQGVYMPLWGRD
jgi:hypothetical protein